MLVRREIEDDGPHLFTRCVYYGGCRDGEDTIGGGRGQIWCRHVEVAVVCWLRYSLNESLTLQHRCIHNPRQRRPPHSGQVLPVQEPSTARVESPPHAEGTKGVREGLVAKNEKTRRCALFCFRVDVVIHVQQAMSSSTNPILWSTSTRLISSSTLSLARPRTSS